MVMVVVVVMVVIVVMSGHGGEDSRKIIDMSRGEETFAGGTPPTGRITGRQAPG